MIQFPETELILTTDHRVYHLNLKNEDVADTVILVGDQNRVKEVSKHFSKIDFKTEHREFITHTGTYKGKRITVLSTGIGPDNIDIVLNELDAAVNIDPATRQLREKKRSLDIYRLGTCGGLQENIPVDSLVVSEYGLGMDGLLNFYKDLPGVNEIKIVEEFVSQTGWLPQLPTPYCIAASKKLFNNMKGGLYTGMTATAPGFYGPQGRTIRLNPAMPLLNERLTDFEYDDLRICNFEMETSALYGLGKLLGHNCLTVCVIIANRIKKEFTTNYGRSIDMLVETCLNKLSQNQ